MSDDEAFYQSEPQTWLRRIARGWAGYRVSTDPSLRDRIAHLDPGRRELLVVPGLSDLRYRSIIAGTVMWAIGGDEWAPEWRTQRPRLHVVPEPREVPLYPSPELYLSRSV